MNDTIKSFLPKYTEIVQDCEKHVFASIDTSLKRHSIKNLTGLAKREDRLKSEIIREGDEDPANQMLALQCLTNSLRYELMMWIDIDEGEYDTAWNSLINAQDAAKSARSAHEISQMCNVERYSAKLDASEAILFPPQQFNSPAIFVESWECNLCGIDYSECPHIAGMAYWGHFCRRVPTKIIDTREVSLVDNPKDKKARIYEVILDGNTVRDQLTRETRVLTEEEEEKYDVDPDDGLTIKSIAMTPDNQGTDFENYFP